MGKKIKSKYGKFFNKYKKDAKTLLENIKPDDKKLFRISQDILILLEKLDRKKFDKFISIINENIKDIRCMCKFKQKGGAPTTRSSTDPLFRCNICFDELQINRDLPENAEQCDNQQCDKWFHTDCINTLIQTRIEQGNINTFNCPFNCGGMFNMNRNGALFGHLHLIQEDDINNIDEWIQHLQQQQQQQNLNDNIDRITSAVFTCLIIVAILIQIRGVYNRGTLSGTDGYILFHYLIPRLLEGMQPDTVVGVRNFILRILAWFEQMTEAELFGFFAQLGGGRRKKKTRKKGGGQPSILIPTKREKTIWTNYGEQQIGKKTIIQTAWNIFKQKLLEQKNNWFPLTNSQDEHNMKGDIIYIKIIDIDDIWGMPWVYMMTRKHLLDSINKKLDYIIIIDDVKSTGKKVHRFHGDGKPYLAERYTFNKHLITPLEPEILEEKLKNKPSMLSEKDVKDILDNRRYYRFGVNGSQFILMESNPNRSNKNDHLIEDRDIIMQVQYDKMEAQRKAFMEEEKRKYEKIQKKIEAKIEAEKRKTHKKGGKRRKNIRRKPIRINPKMRGVFTKKAKKKGMSVQRYANYVIKKYKGKKKTKKQLKLLRQAVFAKTAKKWKKRRGGGNKRKIKNELRGIWNRTKRKRGNKEMNTTELMEAMNSPVKKRIKKTNEQIKRGREEWIKKKLQDDIHQFIELFKKQFGQTTKADIIVYDIQRRKSLKRKQEHPNYKKYIEDYIKNANDASTKIKFINTFINIYNNRLNRKRLSELYDGDPELEKNFFEKNDAMSRSPSGRWNKKDSIIYDGNLGRNSPLDFITDSQPVSLNMTAEDDSYFFNRQG